MKKWSLLLVIVLLGFFNLKGQETLNTQLLNIEHLDIPLAAQPFLTQPILSIELIDARPDSFCIGFLRNRTAIVLRNTLEDEFKKAFSAASEKNKDAYRLLIVVKELWLYDNGIGKTDNVTEIDRANCELIFKSDVYLKREQEYIPLLKIDTICVERKPIEKSINNLFDQFFTYFFDKINHTSINDAFKFLKE